MLNTAFNVGVQFIIGLMLVMDWLCKARELHTHRHTHAKYSQYHIIFDGIHSCINASIYTAVIDRWIDRQIRKTVILRVSIMRRIYQINNSIEKREKKRVKIAQVCVSVFVYVRTVQFAVSASRQFITKKKRNNRKKSIHGVTVLHA